MVTKPNQADIRQAALAKSFDQESTVVKDRFANADLVMAVNAFRSGVDQRLGSSPVTSGGVNANAQTVGDAEKKIVFVPLVKLKDNPFNARSVYLDSKLNSLVRSIRDDGQQMPVVVMEDRGEDGFYILIEGHYRKRALLSIGVESVMAIVVPHLEDIDLYRLSFVLNEERAQQTAIDDAISWNKLLQSGLAKTQDEVATLLHVSKSRVSKTISILELSEPIIELIRSNPEGFNISTAYELRQLSELCSPETLLKTAKDVSDGQYSKRDLIALRDKLLRNKKTRARSSPLELRLGGKKVGMLRVFDSGRILLEVKESTPELQSKLSDAVQNVFKSHRN